MRFFGLAHACSEGLPLNQLRQSYLIDGLDHDRPQAKR
jgi:hypothetical protein